MFRKICWQFFTVCKKPRSQNYSKQGRKAGLSLYCMWDSEIFMGHLRRKILDSL